MAASRDGGTAVHGFDVGTVAATTSFYYPALHVLPSQINNAHLPEFLDDTASVRSSSSSTPNTPTSKNTNHASSLERRASLGHHHGVGGHPTANQVGRIGDEEGPSSDGEDASLLYPPEATDEEVREVLRMIEQLDAQDDLAKKKPPPPQAINTTTHDDVVTEIVTTPATSSTAAGSTAPSTGTVLVVPRLQLQRLSMMQLDTPPPTNTTPPHQNNSIITGTDTAASTAAATSSAVSQPAVDASPLVIQLTYNGEPDTPPELAIHEHDDSSNWWSWVTSIVVAVTNGTPCLCSFALGATMIAHSLVMVCSSVGIDWMADPECHSTSRTFDTVMQAC